MAGGAANAWPAPRTVADAHPQNIKECLRTIKLNSEAILQYMTAVNFKGNINIRRLFENTVEWCDVGMEMPGDASVDEVNTKVDRILNKMENLHQDIARNHQENKQTVTSATKSGINVLSWAKIAAQPASESPIPPSLRTRVQSNGTSTSPGVSPGDLNEDCKIIINIKDSSTIKQFRGMQPSEIRKVFNHRCQKAATEHENARALRAVYAVSARQLKSGDIAIQLRSAAEAETARQNKSHWLSRFGREAKIQITTHSVIVHGVPYKSLDALGGLEMKDQKAIIAMLHTENDYRWGEGVEITRVSWLKSQLDMSKQGSSIVVEFTEPEPANTAVYFGVIWNAQSLGVTRFMREAQVKQCFNCQKFGHIGSQCPSEKPVCTYCAANHSTRDCPKLAGDTVEIKCANCHKVGHTARSKKCEKFAEQLRKAAAAKAACSRFFREPARHLSNPSTGGPSGGSQESSSAGSYLQGYSLTPSEGMQPALTEESGALVVGEEMEEERVEEDIDMENAESAALEEEADDELAMAMTHVPEPSAVVPAKRGPGRPPSDKSKSKSKTPQVTRSKKRQEEEAKVLHIVQKGKLNDGKGIARRRSFETTPQVVKTTRNQNQNQNQGQNSNAVPVGDARADMHSEEMENGDMLPPQCTPVRAHPPGDIQQGNGGGFRLPHNRTQEYTIFQPTSSVQGDSSDHEHGSR